jgi:hypothetical protein
LFRLLGQSSREKWDDPQRFEFSCHFSVVKVRLKGLVLGH